MTDHPTPDPFGEQLGARLHDAADQVDGPAVTRAAVAVAVDRNRRHQARSRALVAGAAAAIAVLGGIAVVTQTGSDPTEQVVSGGPTTTVAEVCDAPVPTTAAPSRTTTGSGSASPADGGTGSGTGPDGEVGTTTTLGGTEGDPAFDVWIGILREQGLVTVAQETALAAGEDIDLTAEQSAALQEYWDEQSAGTTTTAPAFAPIPDPTTTTAAPCGPSSGAGTTTP